jgi:molybdopterin molybdotransferase
MLPVTQAEKIILDLVKPLDSESDRQNIDLTVDLTTDTAKDLAKNLSVIQGRILAESPKSSLDFPHWHNSAMDGYAVRYQDVKDCNSDTPISLEVVEHIPAGKISQVEIRANQAARIFTGAMMPKGADTIVIQENTEKVEPKFGQDRILILSAPEPRQFVRHRGDFYQAEQPLLEMGTQIGAPEIAILAAAQCKQVAVYRRPQVVIFSTGDELIELNQSLSPGEIVDSNRYAISAFAIAAGAEVIDLGIIKDQPEALRKAILKALESADMVISSGGVSVGEYDYVDQVLTELGAEIHIRSVAIKPGKPLTVASFSRENRIPVIYFGLPGNPVSALVSCWRFISSALQKMSGLDISEVGVRFLDCKTNEELDGALKRETYIWGKIAIANGSYEFNPAPGIQNSGNLINLAYVNALAIAPLGMTKIPKDSMVKVMLIDR